MCVCVCICTYGGMGLVWCYIIIEKRFWTIIIIVI